MKKIIVFLLLSFTIFNIGYSSTNKKISKSLLEKKLEKEKKNREATLKKNDEKFRKEMKKFELEARIKTTKGDINLFLYPEAAPLNVANFVYLSQNNFYNGFEFNKILTNTLVQIGSQSEINYETTGYTIKDEFVNWLSFNFEGMVAMSNKGLDTNSSQFFITMIPLKQFNGKYTIIGEIMSKNDMSIVKILKPNDRILSIDIKGKDVDIFLYYFENEIKEWDKVLQNKN